MIIVQVEQSRRIDVQDPKRITNAQAITDAHLLGYLQNIPTLDPTYGTGRFWNLWRPAMLTASDIEPLHVEGQYVERDDFRFLPYLDDTWLQVVFDPPYQLNGTSTGKGPSAKDLSYDTVEYRPVKEVHALMLAGQAECIRVLAPKGYLLVKCQDQVANGRKYWQTSMMWEAAHRLGMRWVDRLDVSGYRAQPRAKDGSPKPQKHAASNYSSLLIFQKPARRRSAADRR